MVAIVIGASGDIGYAVTEKLLKNDYRVLACYNHNGERLLKLADNSDKLNLIPYRVDIGDSAAVTELFSYALSVYGGADAVVNCAAVSRKKLLIDETSEDIARIIDINLTAALIVMREACKIMLGKGGNIVSVSSIWGVKGGCMESVYTAAKAGIIGAVKAAAREMGNSGIRINCVAPGLIDTKMNSLSEDETTEFCADVPLGRVGAAGEAAAAVMYLLSDGASYITGHTLIVDGGYTA